MIGSTDSHTGLAAVEEDNYFGKTSAMEPSAGRSSRVRQRRGWHPLLVGNLGIRYAAVWATETRAKLYSTPWNDGKHATTGPRMIVRFFGGFDFIRLMPQRGALRSQATAKVFRWAAILAAPTGGTPSFLVAALKDPIGANLDRYQIVRAGRTGRATCRRRFTMSHGPAGDQPGPEGKLPLVGTTVDTSNANWTNTIGSPELIAVWKTPTSTRSSERSTMGACLKSRRRVGPLTMRNTTA